MKSILDEDEEKRRRLLAQVNRINMIGPLSIIASIVISALIVWHVRLSAH